ncbi:MAG: dTDP-4-dehydrorhamnose reductase [Candidatus Adiutrix sp.]|jgi:dTDP-4-dehydrorhamnose reductase|nr:dTDP-4-dehydrorhamnose reductase [Candidatus Adiutrix sp.]
MNILLLGSGGRLGRGRGASLSDLGRLHAPGREQADLTKPDRLEKLIRRLSPGVIVNAAAYTAVDQAETEPRLAETINAEAPARLARLARELSAWLIHYSTDYVYDGGKDGWYAEEDPAAPLSVYGRSKLAGDEAVAASGCRHLIFRVSWLFSARGRSFPRSILELARGKESFSVTDDQFGAPTGVELLSNVTALALNRVLAGGPDLSGLYHLAAAGETNWHGFAVHLVAQARRLGWDLMARPENISPAPAAANARPARRPANSRLSTAKLARVFGLEPAPWTYYADRLLRLWTGFRNTPAGDAADLLRP